jgi:hypothetical protein
MEVGTYNGLFINCEDGLQIPWYRQLQCCGSWSEEGGEGGRECIIAAHLSSPLAAWPRPLPPGCEATLSLLQDQPQSFPLSSGQLIGEGAESSRVECNTFE